MNWVMKGDGVQFLSAGQFTIHFSRHNGQWHIYHSDKLLSDEGSLQECIGFCEEANQLIASLFEESDAV